ncbi:gamma-glutamylcyclotransferase [soil metagenome]
MILPVFVYGTLRTGEAGFVELGLGALVEPLGPATVAGTLYDLGEYPGAVLGGESVISGELLLPRDEAVLAMLDAYEVFDPSDPAGSEYLRIRSETEEGPVKIWIYVYNFPLENALPIAGGNWLRRTLP